MDNNKESSEEPRESSGARFVDFAAAGQAVKPERNEEMSPRGMLWSLLLPLGFAFFLTCLFLAMRGVMDLGGMVATGGPYEIAHPAPGYVWIIPVSIIASIIMIMASFAEKSDKGFVNLVSLLFWPAIFLSLGWNFIEYGFFKGRLVGGWIVCGLLFALMGGFPLYFIVKATMASRRSHEARSRSMLLLPQLLGLAAGIIAGSLFYCAIS